MTEDMGGTGHRELYNSPHTPGPPTVSGVLLSQQCGVSPHHGGQLHTRTKAEGTDRLAECQAKPWTPGVGGLCTLGRGCLQPGRYSLRGPAPTLGLVFPTWQEACGRGREELTLLTASPPLQEASVITPVQELQQSHKCARQSLRCRHRDLHRHQIREGQHAVST